MRLAMSFMILLSIVACTGGGDSADTGEAKTPGTSVADQQVASEVRPVACGCSVEEVGHCSNLVMIDGKPVEIANGRELGLGEMEWCGQSGVQAQCAGKVEDGKFVAAELVVQGK